MSSKLSTESYKGVRDFYPEDQARLNYFFDTYRRVCERFGYVEYHASILEPSELYKAKGADNEEIVNEQTYSFIDRGEREVTLRPEMTPTVARMVAHKRRELGFPLRFYSIPNVFRYERPQRGRLREHWQLNVDLFGSHSFLAETEVIVLSYELMLEFGAKPNDFEIHISSRSFLNTLAQELGLDDQKTRAMFALLDRKAKLSEEEFTNQLTALGVLPSYLEPHKVPEDVQKVLNALQAAGITNANFDPSVVRGFAYYTGVVFEVFDTDPQNNRAMWGGGRYEDLTKLFDNESITGVGFGLGDVTLRDFLEVRGLLPQYAPPTMLYIAVTDQALATAASELAQELRAKGVCVAVDFGDRKLGKQIEAASKHKIPYVVVVGETELASGEFKVKNLTSGVEETVARTELPNYFLNL